MGVGMLPAVAVGLKSDAQWLGRVEGFFEVVMAGDRGGNGAIVF